ncbi:MAG: hypothetical protein Alpg2KO_03860 [Alphaproteobacteria bacterium]
MSKGEAHIPQDGEDQQQEASQDDSQGSVTPASPELDPLRGLGIRLVAEHQPLTDPDAVSQPQESEPDSAEAASPDAQAPDSTDLIDEPSSGIEEVSAQREDPADQPSAPPDDQAAAPEPAPKSRFALPGIVRNIARRKAETPKPAAEPEPTAQDEDTQPGPEDGKSRFALPGIARRAKKDQPRRPAPDPKPEPEPDPDIDWNAAILDTEWVVGTGKPQEHTHELPDIEELLEEELHQEPEEEPESQDQSSELFPASDVTTEPVTPSDLSDTGDVDAAQLPATVEEPSTDQAAEEARIRQSAAETEKPQQSPETDPTSVETTDASDEAEVVETVPPQSPDTPQDQAEKTTRQPVKRPRLSAILDRIRPKK